MKRTIFIVYILLSISPIADAQKYVPFPTEDVYWNIYLLSSCSNDMPPDPSLLRYSIQGDTTINDIIYSKLCLEKGDAMHPVSEPVGGIREDGKKVFYYGPGYLGSDFGEEILLYDFNALVDDTIFHDQQGIFKSIVEEIDSVKIGKDYRKRQKVNTWGFHFPDYIIEGIGSVKNGLLGHISDIPTCGQHYWEHVCFGENGIARYLNPAFDHCYPGMDPPVDGSFAPVGATWYYDERFAFEGDVDYILFNSEKDTMVNGEVCRKISKSDILGCRGRPYEEFVFTQNDTTYFYDGFFGEFQILYDFSSEKGDSWVIKLLDLENELDSIVVAVDSTSYDQINGTDLKVLHVTYFILQENFPYNYSSTIYERIGDVHYMFNFPVWDNIACDVNYTQGLRCYEDEALGLYSTGIAESCDLIIIYDGYEPKQSQNIRVYPNPTSSYFEIMLDSETGTEIELFNSVGQKFLHDRISRNTRIDVARYPDGLYFLILKQERRIVGVVKITKY